MRSSAKRAAYLAVLTALGTVLAFLAHILPVGRLALLAIAGVPVCVALMMFGPGWAAGAFAVTAALAFLLFPGVTAAGYAAFFGWYPIVKSLCERVRGRFGSPALKLTAYTAAFLLYRLLAQGLFPAAAGLPWIVLYLLGGAAFFVYDWVYSLFIRFYLDKTARFFP